MKILFKSILSKDFKRIYCINLKAELNICAKVSCVKGIPFTLELGLGLITFVFEIYKVK